MPQPINRIVPDAYVRLEKNPLFDKPDYAILVTRIFFVWARIEHELSILLVRILGADASPALAMYASLTSQHLQLTALDAAAKAALDPDSYLVFQAALSVADSAQTPRNHLAHWASGVCNQRTDLLVFANPKMLKERDYRVAQLVQNDDAVDVMEVARANLFDKSEIIAYSKADLERSLRDLEEAYETLRSLITYLDPSLDIHLSELMSHGRLTREQIRDQALQELNGRRLFREALGRLKAVQKSNPR